MKDEQTLTLVESINLNPNLDACAKLDLIKKTMSDCREKQVGAILIEAIEKKEKSIKKKKEEYHKLQQKSLEYETPKKRGRGRPKKIKSDGFENTVMPRTEHQKRMIEAAKEGDKIKE